MSLTTSMASWHPAFMPNSISDPPQKDQGRSYHPNLTRSRGPAAGTETLDGVPHASETEKGIIGHDETPGSANQTPFQQSRTSVNEDHSDIVNLRDALTKSLASPGGVEMDESPVHSSIAGPDDIGKVVPTLPEKAKAEFPTERPAHEPGHASSASFARTVPRDVDWGEDDEFDIGWDHQGADSEPFNIIPASDRTSSFPQVIPIRKPGSSSSDDEYPEKQPEAIGGRPGMSSDVFANDGENEDFFNHIAETAQLQEGDDSFNPDVTSETRYEEGIPLIGASDPYQSAFKDPEIADLDPFAETDPHAEEDFFGSVAAISESNDHPAPGRKSTTQVINPIGLEPFESGNEDHIWKAGPPSEVDLAAQWKAALDEDEFLDEDLLDEEASPEANTVDPAALFGSDDEGFLDDDDVYENTLPDGLSTTGLDNPTSSVSGAVNNSDRRYLPTNVAQTPVPPVINPYAPQASLFTDLSAQSTQNPTRYGIGAGPAMTSPPTSYSAPRQNRPEPAKLQSFADKSKGGYASPYDLPMEVVKPRKRATMQSLPRGSNPALTSNIILPPRSSSIATQGQPPSGGSGSSLSPPLSGPSPSQVPSKPSKIPLPAKQSMAPTSQAKGSFFEDLPTTSRPRPAGRYTPQPSPVAPNDHGAFGAQAPPQAVEFHDNSTTAPASQLPTAAHGLVAPPRANPYASLPSAQSQPPIPSSRYSPAPGRASSGSAPSLPASHGRYAAAPSLQHQQSSSARSTGSAPSPPPPILPHQPRTSSPLIHFERAQDQQSHGAQAQVAEKMRTFRRGSSGLDQGTRSVSLPTTQELDERGTVEGYVIGAAQGRQAYQDPAHETSYNSPDIGPPVPSNHSQPSHYPEQFNLSPSKRILPSYVPGNQPSSISQGSPFVPPLRSQTQSPSKVMAGPRIDPKFVDNSRRPSSAHSPTSSPQIDQYHALPVSNTRTRMRGLSQGLNYTVPTDGRELDPLQRWRGGPVLAWGVGGTIVTSFPKELPRYGVSQTTPMIICSPGEIRIRNLKDVYPLEEQLSTFPGPLKSKSKKKDLITWLTAGINRSKSDAMNSGLNPAAAHEDKRKEERVLLWEILRVMVENDGILEGNPIVNKAVRVVLTPGLDVDENGDAQRYTTPPSLTGISRAPGSTVKPEPDDPRSVDELRKYLLRGEREKAVWEAVEKRLWAHALLISNTLSKEIHKQVAQEFIQKEVKNIGENTESLAALYEVFAGNFEESVDELVPPSARAGFQMVSTTGSSGQSKTSIDGLDRWRETLGLILSNRSPEDGQAIKALGNLLAGYGRAEAAHVCLLFARGYSLFGGLDDPASNIVLVGSDQLRQPNEFDKELEPILLSEIYEYGLSISTASNITFSAPHLAAYKLQHAKILAQTGQREKALQYCEAIASSITSQVRRSAYHHALLVAALDDLSKRLKQSPKDESSTWISKPNVEKISGSVWATFNKFVAGDENDAALGPASDAGSEVGPFAKISGDTPIISRSPSNADIYGSYNGIAVNGSASHPALFKSTSRYAPGAAYAPSGAQDLPSSSHGSPPRGNFTNQQVTDEARHQTHENNDLANSAYPLSPNNYSSRNHPEPSQQTPYSPYSPHGFQNSGGSSALRPPGQPAYERQMSFSSNGSHRSNPASEGDNSAAGYMPPTASSYEPPSSESYEPPSYEPAVMNDEMDSPVDTRNRKESFNGNEYEPQTMNAIGNAAGSRAEKSKAEKDREADEAFRKAAEADAQKGTQASPAKKGWGLGGWFAKKENPSDAIQPNKPIRAKLGEENSFYYDPELKRWVNKKAGKDGNSETSTATPPPPRAGPPRTATGTPSEYMSKPRFFDSSAPPQRAVSASVTSNPSQLSDGPSGLSVPPISLPMSRSISNGSAAGPPSRPSSRPTTSTSNASSIDDLLGPPTSRKGTAKKPKKGRGYIDVMGEKTST